MDEAMFCYQCQETCCGTGCTKGGRCGKNAETANLMDTLISELKAIALTLDERPSVTREFSRFICRAMFATITNANFNQQRIVSLIDEARRARCTLDSKIEPPPAGVLACADPNIRSAREIVIYGIKGISAYAFHALALGKEDNSIYNFIIQALAATARDTTPFKTLVDLIMKCGQTAVTAMALLDQANTEAYGNPTMCRISCKVGSRPGILVSGHDLKDLEELLKQTDGKGIDIYTHGEMLPANTYPELKKYSHLIGNYGGAWWDQTKDFETFNGVILLTSNCLVPVKDSYKDRLFTTNMVGYPGIPHIMHRHIGCQKDFSPVIEAAKKYPAPTLAADNTDLFGGFGHYQVCSVIDQIIDHLKAGHISRFIVMAGCDGRDKSREYFTEVAKLLPKDTVILTAGCAKYRYNRLNLGDIYGIPRVLDAGQCNDSYSLVRIALTLQDKLKIKNLADLPISFDLAWYEQKAVAVLLALLFLGFRNIRLGPTLPAFVSPDVLQFLVKNFNIMPTGEPKADVDAMMAGK